jgi:steroid 5-alpha reductase family enzyme
MTILYLEALAAIALSLSVLMAGAWMVQQRTGNRVGAGSALWPVAGSPPNARQWLVAALVAIWSPRLGSHIAVRTAGISDDPRYAAFAREWGAGSPRKMFIFLQNQGFGSIPRVFALVYVTGIPPLEQQMLRSRGERYRDYQARTSAFFPLPPQKEVVT